MPDCEKCPIEQFCPAQRLDTCPLVDLIERHKKA